MLILAPPVWLSPACTHEHVMIVRRPQDRARIEAKGRAWVKMCRPPPRALAKGDQRT